MKNTILVISILHPISILPQLTTQNAIFKTLSFCWEVTVVCVSSQARL